jgi:hypothetical protein
MVTHDAKELERVRLESAIASPLVKQAEGLTVKTARELADADEIRHRLDQHKKAIIARLEKIISPVYTSLQELYKLRREMTDPLDKADKIISDKMRVYHRLEAERIAEEKAEIEAAAEKERNRAEELRRKAEIAKTPQMQARLATQAAEKDSKAAEIEETEVEKTHVMHSKTRTVKKPVVGDMSALIKAVAAGEVPEDLLTVNAVVLTSYWREDPDLVAQFPGIKIAEDIQVVRR